MIIIIPISQQCQKINFFVQPLVCETILITLDLGLDICDL